MVTAWFSGLMVPVAVCVQVNEELDPVALPFSVIDAPELTTYGPPVLATGDTQPLLGLMVTVVDTGAEETPAAFVAVTVTVTFVTAPTEGALKVTFAELGPEEVATRFCRATGPVWVTDQVNGTEAGTLESEPLTAKLPASPEFTVWGAIGFTMGASAALTVMVAFAVETPQLFVAVSDALTTVWAATWGAV